MKKTTPPAKDHLESILGRAAMRLKAELGRAFRAAGADVTPEQWGVLVKLWERDGLHQQRLADLTGKDRHTMARILQLMEKKELIERRFDKADSRRFNAFLTTKGKRLRQTLPKAADKARARALAGLDKSELEILADLLARILGNLEPEAANKSQHSA